MEQNWETRNKPYIYSQLIVDKGAKSSQRGKNSLFNKWYWDNWISTSKRMKLDSLAHIVYKNELKMDQRPNVRATTIKFLEENMTLN